MKLLLPLLCLACAVLISCQEAEPPILPTTHIEAEIETCNLSSLAIVEFREARDESSGFYFLTLLDERGNRVGDVYTGSILGKGLEVGDQIEINYHYLPSNGMVYDSACGDEEDHQATKEQMAQIVICVMSDHS